VPVLRRREINPESTSFRVASRTVCLLTP